MTIPTPNPNQGLTQWQFITIGIYFGLTTCLTYLAMRTPPEALDQRGWASLPSPPACAAASLLGVITLRPTNPDPDPSPSPNPDPNP